MQCFHVTLASRVLVCPWFVHGADTQVAHVMVTGPCAGGRIRASSVAFFFYLFTCGVTAVYSLPCLFTPYMYTPINAKLIATPDALSRQHWVSRAGIGF